MSSKSEISEGMAEFKVESENPADTLVVLEFSPEAPAETKDWLTALIRSPGVFRFMTFKIFFTLRLDEALVQRTPALKDLPLEHNAVLEIIFLYSQDICPFKSSFWSDI